MQTVRVLNQDNLGERLARLEKMFNRITEQTDSHYSVQLEPNAHAQTSSLQNLHVSSSHDPPASSLHDPLAFLLHDPFN